MLNGNHSVYPQAEFKVKDIVRKCLVSFPWIWVRVDMVSINDTWLTVLPV